MVTEVRPVQARAARRGPHLATGWGAPAGVGAFTLLALVLRLALAGRGGMWRDEAQMLWIVRSETVRQLLQFLRDHESHPPLFYLLMRAWLGLFGDTEVAALALPVLLGVVLVLALYRTGSETFGRRTGLVAAALAASAPMLAWHSALARPYSLMPLLCLGSVAFLERGLRGGRLRTWVAYAAVTLAMLLTHNWGWLVLAGQWAVVLPWLSLCPSRAATLGWLAAQVGIALGFLPWIEAFVYQVHHAGYEGGTPPSTTELVMLLSSLVTADTHHRISLVIVTVLATAAVCRRVYTPRSVRRGPGDATDRGETFALGLLIGVPLATITLAVLLSSRTNLLIPWTMTTIVPCLFLALAHGIACLSRTGRVLPMVVTVGLLMGLHLNTIRAELRSIRSNGREVAPAVAERDRPDDLLLVTPQWIASSFYYYYPGDTPGVDYPTEPFRGPIYYDDLKQRLLDPNRFARLKARLTRAHRDGQRIWLVTERGLEPGGDLPESADLGTLPSLTTYHKVGGVRARQLRAHLDELYGPPRTDAVPVDNRTGPEILDVYLYERKNR